MVTLFYWDDDNEAHIAEHGIHRLEAQWVALHGARGYPEDIGDGKRRVRGRNESGGYLQVIYVERAIETVDIERLEPADRLRLSDDPQILYIIHARPLNERERRQLRRRSRS